MDRVKANTILECTLPDNTHTLRDNNRCEAIAILKNITVNAVYTILLPFIHYRRRYGDSPTVLRSILRHSDRSRMVIPLQQFIPYSINLHDLCTHRKTAQQHGGHQCEMFHVFHFLYVFKLICSSFFLIHALIYKERQTTAIFPTGSPQAPNTLWRSLR